MAMHLAKIWEESGNPGIDNFFGRLLYFLISELSARQVQVQVHLFALIQLYPASRVSFDLPTKIEGDSARRVIQLQNNNNKKTKRSKTEL